MIQSGGGLQKVQKLRTLDALFALPESFPKGILYPVLVDRRRPRHTLPRSIKAWIKHPLRLSGHEIGLSNVPRSCEKVLACFRYGIESFLGDVPHAALLSQQIPGI